MVEEQIEKSFPDIIYKYFKFNENLYDLIINNRLWFSNPSDFNDPYDCNVGFHKKYTKEEISNFLKNVQSTTNEKLTEEQIKETLEEWLNEPNKMQEQYIRHLREFVNSKGVCCFSGTDKNLLMWSHYADSHKGMCLGFDKKSLDKSFAIINWVNYKDKFPDIHLLNNSNDGVNTIMKHKSNVWDYEKEIRIFHGKKGLYQFPREAIKQVFFGLKTPDRQIHSVMNLMHQCGYSDVEYKKVFLHNEKYDIEYGTVIWETNKKDNEQPNTKNQKYDKDKN